MDYVAIIEALTFVAIGLILGMAIDLKGKHTTKGIYNFVLVYSILLLLLASLNWGFYFNSDETTELQPHYYTRASLINILTAGSTMGLGAISVFVTQRHFEEKKREETRNDVAGPLFLEITN